VRCWRPCVPQVSGASAGAWAETGRLQKTQPRAVKSPLRGFAFPFDDERLCV